MENFMQWYFIMGFLTCLLGMYRAYKYNIETDELTVLACFLIWWFFIFTLLLKMGLKFSNDKKQNKSEKRSGSNLENI